jgi:tripartite-type tricarboxylate transporter receptor subunit TctC
MRLTTTRRAFAGALLALGLATPAFAAYPDKPIRVIVPFPAGGGGDILARTVINKIAEQTGWTFVIENRAGAGGNIGTEAAARSTPDGYTLAYGTNGTHGINHALYKRTGFDPITDFEPISRFTQIALLMVVNNDVPAKSPKELLDYLKANPGKVNIGSAGNGTTSHLASEIFRTATGVNYQHVPYRGGGPAKTDLISGQIQMMIEIMPSVYPNAQQGQVRALAVTTDKRWPLAPDVPTIAETIVPGFRVSAWDGLWAPKGTPKEIIATLNAAARKALSDPQLRDELLKRGAEPVPSTPEELGQFVAAELPRWKQAVDASGAKID